MYVVAVSVGQITPRFSRNDTLTLFSQVKPDDYHQFEPYKVGISVFYLLLSLKPHLLHPLVVFWMQGFLMLLLAVAIAIVGKGLCISSYCNYVHVFWSLA